MISFMKIAFFSQLVVSLNVGETFNSLPAYSDSKCEPWHSFITKYVVKDYVNREAWNGYGTIELNPLELPSGFGWTGSKHIFNRIHSNFILDNKEEVRTERYQSKGDPYKSKKTTRVNNGFWIGEEITFETAKYCSDGICDLSIYNPLYAENAIDFKKLTHSRVLDYYTTQSSYNRDQLITPCHHAKLTYDLDTPLPESIKFKPILLHVQVDIYKIGGFKRSHPMTHTTHYLHALRNYNGNCDGVYDHNNIFRLAPIEETNEV